MGKGKLIVIDGTDGSGKKTQAELLLERMRKEGLKAGSISFPQYGKKSAGPVEDYLNDKYGKAPEVDPYIASLFFAVDRFDLSPEIRKKLSEGNIIVTDRYVDSNAGHQGGKIKDAEERKRFISWLYDIEYRILRIPKPDAVFVLHVPAEIGQKLVLEKQQRLYIEGEKRQDGHEADLNHLKSAENSYLWLCEQFPHDHKIIECFADGKLLTREEIHEKIWNEFIAATGMAVSMENSLVTEKL